MEDSICQDNSVDDNEQKDNRFIVTSELDDPTSFVSHVLATRSIKEYRFLTLATCHEANERIRSLVLSHADIAYQPTCRTQVFKRVAK